MGVEPGVGGAGRAEGEGAKVGEGTGIEDGVGVTVGERKGVGIGLAVGAGVVAEGLCPIQAAPMNSMIIAAIVGPPS